jgi:hypothetical protein
MFSLDSIAADKDDISPMSCCGKKMRQEKAYFSFRGHVHAAKKIFQA